MKKLTDIEFDEKHSQNKKTVQAENILNERKVEKSSQQESDEQKD